MKVNHAGHAHHNKINNETSKRGKDHSQPEGQQNGRMFINQKGCCSHNNHAGCCFDPIHPFEPELKQMAHTSGM